MPRRRSSSDGPDDRDIRNAFNAFSQLDPRIQMGIVIALVVVALIAGGIWLWDQRHPTGQVTAPTSTVPAYVGSPNLLLGNPSGATADPSNRDNFLMVKPYFVLAFNNSLGTPNWVSWQVRTADLGEAQRKRVFDTDMTLPMGFSPVTTKDYTGSGFDRGHMCPHSDRAANTDMSFATFVMTNIIPQAPHVNQKAWAQLESYSRGLAENRQHLFIVSGPAGRGGRGSNGPRESLADGKVTVPAECWKVVVVVPQDGGDNDLAKISPTTRVITVIMPNDNDAVGEEWAKFRTTPAEVERRTGFHFFTNLSPEVADALRQKKDDTFVPLPRPMTHGKEPSE